MPAIAEYENAGKNGIGRRKRLTVHPNCRKKKNNKLRRTVNEKTAAMALPHANGAG